MCDEKSLQDMERHLLRQPGALTRRRFGALMIGAGVAASLPRMVNALEVAGTGVEIRTADGLAEAYFTHPAQGRYPGVLMWPDAYGLRDSFRRMADRLAAAGYAVLVPNPYYRSTRLPAFAEPIDMKDPGIREHWAVWRALLTPAAVASDATAFGRYLDQQPAVDGQRPLGTLGYCMGGPMTLQTAAALPERIAAGASFHGAGLVTERPDSPHLLVAKIRARYLIAIAESDDQRQPQAKDVLREAFSTAGLPAEIEVYAGTQHGWCPPDMPVYDEAQAERAWSRMLALFGSALARATPGGR